MLVPVNNLVVNRSSLTREFKIAGSPILQMATHMQAMDHSPRGSFESSAYDLIRSHGHEKGNHHSYASLDKLAHEIMYNGVLENVSGWRLDDNTFELFGGHHRAIIAHIAGIEVLNLALKPLSPDEAVFGPGLKSIQAAYDEVPKSESLRPGYSYNPFAEMKAIRPTAEDRLRMIYKAIITCSGNRLLDLGCNDGYFGAALSLHDFEPTFVDRSSAYLNVVYTKMEALKRPYFVFQTDIDEFIASHDPYDVVLYTDVFYHTVIEKGKDAALAQLHVIASKTYEQLIFAPGRWDKLEQHGVTQKMLYQELMPYAKRIRYLGYDKDDHYGREIYCIEY